MFSALLGLALILLIAVITVALGALTRLLAAWIVGPAVGGARPDLTIADRIALGNELIARDLQPDDVHPVARTAQRDVEADRAVDTIPRQDLALRFPTIAAHALR